MKRIGNKELIFITGPPGAGKTSMAVGYKNNHRHVEQFGNGDFMRDLRAGNVGSEYSEIVQSAVRNHEMLPDDVFAGAFYEKAMKVSDDTKLLFVTGFPYTNSDWENFYEQVQTTGGISIIGAIALNAGIQTCVDRMQQRDVIRGIDGVDIYTEHAVHSYKQRYFAHMARSAIRLDCFRQSNITITTISAEQSMSSVYNDFSLAVSEFRGK